MPSQFRLPWPTSSSAGVLSKFHASLGLDAGLIGMLHESHFRDQVSRAAFSLYRSSLTCSIEPPEVLGILCQHYGIKKPDPTCTAGGDIGTP